MAINHLDSLLKASYSSNTCMKLVRLRYIYLTFVLPLIMVLSSCDSLIFDDLSNCPQGVYVSFYSKTECAQDSSYPGVVQDLYLFAFDSKDQLVAVDARHNPNLSKDYELLMYLKPGYYTFVAWAGNLDKNVFDLSDLRINKSTKQDVYMTLKSKGATLLNVGNRKVWSGVSPVAELKSLKEKGAVDFIHTSVNLLEQTNRINVEVELHESVLKDVKPQDFRVEVGSSNYSLNLNGSIRSNLPQLAYLSTNEFTANKLISKFVMLPLEYGRNNEITIVNQKDGKVVWNGDLIGSILLKNPNINLNCLHDFNIKFVIKDKCLDCHSYVCWAIYIDDWQIHSYQTDL